MIKRLFIHPPKTGGLTIRYSPTLRSHLIFARPNIHISKDYTKRLHETMKITGDHHGNEHARYQDIKPEIRNAYSAFAFIRNPWDRVISRFKYAKKLVESGQLDPRYVDVSSLEAFLEERHRWGGKDFFWHRAIRGWFNQVDHVVNEKQIISVDCLRFENYNQDLMKYFNLSEFNDPVRNISDPNSKPYREYYDDKTLQIVADWYKPDIDTFGFDFNSGAKRNVWNR